QRLATREQNDPRIQSCEAGQQALHGLEIHVGAAVTPVIAGDAARVAALRQVQRYQRQAVQMRVRDRIAHQRLCRQSTLQSHSRNPKVLSYEPDLWPLVGPEPVIFVGWRT